MKNRGEVVIIVNQKSPKPVVRPVLEGRPKDVPVSAKRPFAAALSAQLMSAGSIL